MEGHILKIYHTKIKRKKIGRRGDVPGKLILDSRKGILKIENKREKKNGDVPTSPPCTIGFCAPVWLLTPQERTRPRVEKT